jgi:hypothetical protein
MACSVFSYSIYPWALEMGGRYQKVHEFRNTCAELDAVFISEMEAMLGARPTVLPVESLAPVFPAGTAEPMAVSKGFADDLGVLAEPKEANAPDPRPKALEAPVGEVKPPPGVVALKGPFFAEEGVSPPVRREREAFFEESELLVPVERESLLLLELVLVTWFAYGDGVG